MSNPHKGRTGVDRLLRATRYSIHGLGSAYRHESAFRQELWISVVLIPVALILGRNLLERALLLGTLLVVLIVELLNSGIEATVDRVSYEEHPLAKRAKDYGSAAVMLSLVLCVLLWLAVAWQRVAA
jgi:diacylglycerol kinase (ATP)